MTAQPEATSVPEAQVALREHQRIKRNLILASTVGWGDIVASTWALHHINAIEHKTKSYAERVAENYKRWADPSTTLQLEVNGQRIDHRTTIAGKAALLYADGLLNQEVKPDYVKLAGEIIDGTLEEQRGNLDTITTQIWQYLAQKELYDAGHALGRTPLHDRHDALRRQTDSINQFLAAGNDKLHGTNIVEMGIRGIPGIGTMYDFGERTMEALKESPQFATSLLQERFEHITTPSAAKLTATEITFIQQQLKALGYSVTGTPAQIDYIYSQIATGIGALMLKRNANVLDSNTEASHPLAKAIEVAKLTGTLDAHEPKNLSLIAQTMETSSIKTLVDEEPTNQVTATPQADTTATEELIASMPPTTIRGQVAPAIK